MNVVIRLHSDRRVRVVHRGMLLYKKKIDTAGSDEGGLIKRLAKARDLRVFMSSFCSCLYKFPLLLDFSILCNLGATLTLRRKYLLPRVAPRSLLIEAR